MTPNRNFTFITGWSLVLMALIAGFSYGYVYNGMVIPGDAYQTFQNLKDGHALLNASIFGWGVILVLDLIVAWALYYIFVDVNQKLSLWMAILRVVYVVFLVWAMWGLISVSMALSGGMEEVVKSSLSVFEKAWSLGLIPFGIHLFLLGVLAIQYDKIPNFWGILLVVAGLAYLLVHTLKNTHFVAMTVVDSLESWLALPMTIGEVGFAIWLLIKGKKLKN